MVLVGLSSWFVDGCLLTVCSHGLFSVHMELWWLFLWIPSGGPTLMTSVQFSSVQSLSPVQLFANPWTVARQASLSITNSQSLLKLMSIESVMPSHPQSSPSPSIFKLSQHSSHQVAKVLEFQLQHQSFQWIFRTDFLQDGLVGSPCSPKDSQESSLLTLIIQRPHLQIPSQKPAVYKWGISVKTHLVTF